jgi:hypothetical protein
VRLDLIDEPRLVAGHRQEYAHQLDDVVARKHQPRIAAARIELRQLLAQKREQQAHRKGERTASDEPRKLRRRFVVAWLGAAAQERIAFGLVEHEIQPEHRHVIAHARLQVDERAPQPLVAFAVHHALEQRDRERR